MKLSIILATDINNGIAYQNKLPWENNYPEDLKYFSNTTSNSIVIMGSKTYFSLPEKYRPLPNRYNIILTKNVELYDKRISTKNSFAIFTNLDNLSDNIINSPSQYNKEIFVIGGKEIYDIFYAKTLQSDLDFYINKIYITRINKSYNSDLFIDFPHLSDNYSLIFDKNSENKDLSFYVYQLIE